MSRPNEEMQQQQQQQQSSSSSPVASTPSKNDHASDGDDSTTIHPSPATDHAALQLLQLHHHHRHRHHDNGPAAAAVSTITSRAANNINSFEVEQQRQGYRGAADHNGPDHPHGEPAADYYLHVGGRGSPRGSNNSNNNTRLMTVAAAAFPDEYELDDIRRRVRIRRQLPENAAVTNVFYNSNNIRISRSMTTVCSESSAVVEGQFDDADIDSVVPVLPPRLPPPPPSSPPVEGQFDDADVEHVVPSVLPPSRSPNHHHNHHPNHHCHGLCGHAHVSFTQPPQQQPSPPPWNSPPPPAAPRNLRHGRLAPTQSPTYTTNTIQGGAVAARQQLPLLAPRPPPPRPQQLPLLAPRQPPPPPRRSPAARGPRPSPFAAQHPSHIPAAAAVAVARQQQQHPINDVTGFGCIAASAGASQNGGSWALLSPRPGPKQQQQVVCGAPPSAAGVVVSTQQRPHLSRTRVSATTPTILATCTTNAARKCERRAEHTISPLPPVPLPLPPVVVESASAASAAVAGAAAAAAAAAAKQSPSNPCPTPGPSAAAAVRTSSYGTKLTRKNGTFLDIFINAAARISDTNTNSSVGLGLIRQHPSDLLIPDNGVDPSLRLQQSMLPTAAEESVAASTATTAPSTLIATQDIADTDILLGRGALTNRHVGNMAFRELVALYRPAYCTAQKYSKSQLARNLLLYLRLLGVRFLQKHNDSDNKTNKTTDDSNIGDDACCFWVECGNARAQAKVGQGLREGASSVVRETLIKSMSQTKQQQQSTTTARQPEQDDDGDEQENDYSTESAREDPEAEAEEASSEEKKENEETLYNVESDDDGDDDRSSSSTTSGTCNEAGDEPGMNKKRKRRRRSSTGTSDAMKKKKSEPTQPIADETSLKIYDI